MARKLYHETEMSPKEIRKTLHISKTTLYRYLANKRRELHLSMNEDGSNKDARYAYFHADKDGNPDRPMNKKESIEYYWQITDEDPSLLADLYLDFYTFSRIEFLIFKDRLSSAILVPNAAKKTIAEMESKFKAQQESGSHRIPRWEGESDLALEEDLGIIGDTYRISIGATVVTAVAALESLLIDLTPDSDPKPKGLHRLLLSFLKRYKVPKSLSEHLTEMELKVGRRRNTFAHTLTGSYFANDQSLQAMFTPETMEDTLYTVSEIALLMEELVLANDSSDSAL
jgi:hypothetical protein